MTNEPRGLPNSDFIEDMLVKHARYELSRPKWWQRVWGRVAIAGGALVLVSSTAVAAVVLLDSQPVTDTAVVHCLDRGSRNLDGSLPGAAVSVAAPGGVIPISDAVGVCEQMWAAGSFTSEDPLNPTPSPGDVPKEFTTCVTNEGTAAIVPGRVECSTLKLHPWQD